MTVSNINAKDFIYERYQALVQEQPEIRARDAAKKLSISEGELLASRVGVDATRLIDDAEEILRKVLSLGEVMALTRNDACVHERKGVYDNGSFSKHGPMAMGLFVNADIDLRLFMNHWQYSFAAIEQTRGGLRKSLQFFDKAGTAIHKIYLTQYSNEEAYDNLVKALRHEKQETTISVEPYTQALHEKADDDVDWQAFRSAWEALQDTHDFYPMLRKFKVGREQAFAKIGSDFAYEVDNSAARQVLTLVRDRKAEMMVFVGNHGCIQIHTGPVNKLLEHGTWFNVMDPAFNLHLQETEIARTWVTKKPTADGIVTALEIFDKNGELIATFFGKRKPGIQELSLWREIIQEIPFKKEAAHVA
ncbi:MAG: hemin-degrading factor [Methylotenera sp.]|jgi:putative hemin transport protein